MASARATADNAESDLHRNEPLYQTHVIDRREYDASVARAKSAAANVDSATKKVASQEAQVSLASAQRVTAASGEKQAEAQVRLAQLQLSYTKIFAPFDGRVTKKSVEPGNYVQPGQTLFFLVLPDVWVIANFKETQLKRMKVGQAVSVRVDAIPGRDFNAHIESFQAGTGSRFTLLPPENATGNFVKVVQRVPVKIVFFFLFGFILFSSTVLIPQLLQSLDNYDAITAGMALTPGALVIVAMAPSIVRLTLIAGAKRLILIGFFFLAMAVWHLGHISLNANYGVFGFRIGVSPAPSVSIER